MRTNGTTTTATRIDEEEDEGEEVTSGSGSVRATSWRNYNNGNNNNKLNSLTILSQQWTTVGDDKRNHHHKVKRETEKMASILHRNGCETPLVERSSLLSMLSPLFQSTIFDWEENEEEDDSRKLVNNCVSAEKVDDRGKRKEGCDCRRAMASYNKANKCQQIDARRSKLSAEKDPNERRICCYEQKRKFDCDRSSIKQVLTNQKQKSASRCFKSSAGYCTRTRTKTSETSLSYSSLVRPLTLIDSSTSGPPNFVKRKPAKHRKVIKQSGRSCSSSVSLLSFQLSQSSSTQCRNNNQMILLRIAQLVFIYILITSSITIPATTTNYWPSLRKHHEQQQQQQIHELSSPVINADSQSPPRSSASSPQSHQLMIGQHYKNFSSIVPYSIVQDSDYGNPIQEDQILDEQEQDGSSPYQENLHHQGDTRSDTTTDIHEGALKSRALLPLDSNRLILPQMQQIKSRFNQGCVGGTKCQFFAFCWMSGGSLGASCGLLMTCCVTPSRQEIQPGFYGPVVNDPYCGRSTSKINRIVGGTDASFGQFPWQAFVQVGGSRCGGALISSRHVVTAGHCVARSQHSPSSIKVTLGDYILNSDIESIPHEVFSVVEVLLHPNFRFTPQADRYDVAVLELDRTASYKDNIKPICLPQKDAAFVGRVAYVAGWGALQAGSKLRPKVLQHVAVPVIENHVCESWHRRKGIDIRIYDEMMCAGYEMGQRDACQGDSGGPLMLNQFGVWYLVGIVSAGYSCAKQYQPGIYHRVSSSSDWISSNVYQQGSNK